MSTPQTTYRVYCFDSIHQIVSVDLIEAASDAEAIAKAEAADFGSKCEIWDRRRMVAQLTNQRLQA